MYNSIPLRGTQLSILSSGYDYYQEKQVYFQANTYADSSNSIKNSGLGL